MGLRDDVRLGGEMGLRVNSDAEEGENCAKKLTLLVDGDGCNGVKSWDNGGRKRDSERAVFSLKWTLLVGKKDVNLEG
jgi:hypothetical protein